MVVTKQLAQGVCGQAGSFEKHKRAIKECDKAAY